MKERLISYETAKLAKERGFDEKCLYLFREELYSQNRKIDKITKFIDSDYTKNSFCAKNDYCIPAQSLLQKWLREKHDIHVNPEVQRLPKNNTKYGIKVNSKETSSWFDDFNTYEEALEVGLYGALNLIK